MVAIPIRRFLLRLRQVSSLGWKADRSQDRESEVAGGPRFDPREGPFAARPAESMVSSAGREIDAEAGLYYSRARAYCVELEAFINRDPLAYAPADDTDPYHYPDAPPDETGI
jgi:RHS repeat-associated protein